jgi:D-sedoheptulose 7-phosphate isomerase
MKFELNKVINDAIKLKKELIKLNPNISKAIDLMTLTLKKGNKIFICGNGGSAADAQHLAAEFLIRLRPKINRRPYPVISLAQDTSTLTACGNDIGFENIFKRNLEALANKKDLLITLSTSGNSKNIIKVLKFAKSKNIKSISFLGNKGGKCKGLSNIELEIPHNNTARIQECHIFLGHFIFENVENRLLKIKSNV